ncbi:DUF4091 domain-containing protein [Bifidobacterium aerophilum]|nr:DUF4091 domain-containing protein [Bifidobacterium aerophilum]
MAAYRVIPIGSLEKLLPSDDARALPSIDGVTGLAGETVSFQLAYRVEDDQCHEDTADTDSGLCGTGESGDVTREIGGESGGHARDACVNQFVTRVSMRGAFAEYAHIRAVRDVPVDFPCYPGKTDDMYLSERPGLYPDLLQDTNGWVAFMPDQWRSLWVDIDLPAMSDDGHVARSCERNAGGRECGAQDPFASVADVADACSSANIVSGSRPDAADVEEPSAVPVSGSLIVEFRTPDGETVNETAVSISRIPVQLPALDIAHTEWFHADCLAQYYGVPVWGEEHWRIVERFVALAAKRGVTMIYTPLFTPPLDTEVGGERPTTQLVGVTRTGGSWSFNFSRLERWTRMCDRAGIRRFEMSHLFTQWGAEHCPKIMATVDGTERRVFGWDTSATADGYPEFLAAFLPALDRELHRLGIADRTVFHVSDEPTDENLDSYLAAKAVVAPYLTSYPIMDALSHIEFYDSGACEHPVPAENRIEPFVAAGVKDLWTYHCCVQTVDVPNRFMAMPSYRNRVLGFLLYVYDLAGFLHWGFNFYNTEYSRRAINPYTEPGCPEGFAAGDAFLVYPGPGGRPEESIRIMVLEEALNDLRACRLLESLTSRDQVLSILTDGLAEPLTFARYPHSAAWLLGRRDAINQAIVDYLGM